MNYKNKNLIKRILDISYKNKLSHLGSYFSCLDVIDNIFDKKKEDDIFILSCGHAALALYCVIEKYHKIDAASYNLWDSYYDYDSTIEK